MIKARTIDSHLIMEKFIIRTEIKNINSNTEKPGMHIDIEDKGDTQTKRASIGMKKVCTNQMGIRRSGSTKEVVQRIAEAIINRICIGGEDKEDNEDREGKTKLN